MGLLARTYAEMGRRQEGMDLLVNCLALLDRDAESATGTDVAEPRLLRRAAAPARGIDRGAEQG